MDNICHTLVGAALAQTGLKRRTGLGAATLMIAANFPDIDVIAVPLGRGTEWRRGVTHGVLALVVLPFVLTALMMWWDSRKRARGADDRQPVVPREILLLSVIGMLTHPTLDWMNSYGMRWLMPFDGTWFYGDSLFIVDPWLMATLGVGIWLSRRREKRMLAMPWQPARIAVALAASYIVAMMGTHAKARTIAGSALEDDPRASARTIVMPSPGRPWMWEVVADDGARYSMGMVNVPASSFAFGDEVIEKRDREPAALAAARMPETRVFLDWARIPHYLVDGRDVTIVDARYGATVHVTVP